MQDASLAQIPRTHATLSSFHFTLMAPSPRSLCVAVLAFLTVSTLISTGIVEWLISTRQKKSEEREEVALSSTASFVGACFHFSLAIAFVLWLILMETSARLTKKFQKNHCLILTISFLTIPINVVVTMTTNIISFYRGDENALAIIALLLGILASAGEISYKVKKKEGDTWNRDVQVSPV